MPQDPQAHPSSLPLHSELVTHPNGQTTRIIVDDFTDPWLPSSQKETILIQPGFGRHADFWYHWIPTLTRSYRVVRRDLRGHGYSSIPDVAGGYQYNIDTVLAEMVDLLDQMGLDRVHLLGESTGGMVCIAFAARHPERVKTLTLCATPTHLPPPFFDICAMGHASWPDAVRKLGSRGWMQALSKEPGGIGQTDPAYSTWWLDQVALNPTEGLALYAEFLSEVDVEGFHGQVARNATKVLVLAPTRSRMTALEDQRSYRERISGCQVVEIDGRGHEIFVDKADECQGALLRFLAQLK